MKYRKRLLAGGALLIIAGLGSAVALQPPPKPVHLSKAITQPAKPQFQPQVTTYIDPPAPAAPAAPAAATDSAAVPPAVATPPSSCSAADQTLLNTYRSDLASWTAYIQSQGRSTDLSIPTNMQGRILTTNISVEVAKGCQ